MPGRIWVSRLQVIKNTVPGIAQIRCSSREFSDEEITQLTAPETEPDPSVFLPVQNLVNYRGSMYHVPKKIRNKNSLTVLMDFSGGRKMTLKGNLPAAVYCNGKRLKKEKGILNFDAPSGKCRILLRYGKSKRILDRLQLILTPADREVK